MKVMHRSSLAATSGDGCAEPLVAREASKTMSVLLASFSLEPRDDVAWKLLVLAAILPPTLWILRRNRWQISLRFVMLMLVVVGPLSLLLTDDIARIAQRLSAESGELQPLNRPWRPTPFDPIIDGIRYGVIPCIVLGMSLAFTLAIATINRWLRSGSEPVYFPRVIAFRVVLIIALILWALWLILWALWH